MRQPFLAPYRRELLATVGGDILEIGFGTGLNLPFYPPQVRKITAVDPNVGMHAKAKKRIAQSRIEVDRRWFAGVSAVQSVVLFTVPVWIRGTELIRLTAGEFTGEGLIPD